MSKLEAALRAALRQAEEDGLTDGATMEVNGEQRTVKSIRQQLDLADIAERNMRTPKGAAAARRLGIRGGRDG